MEELNIYQKLAKIRKQVEIMKRDKKAYGYNYTQEESILARITVFMDKFSLSLIPGIVPGTTVVSPYSYKKTKVMKDGTVYEENVNEVLVSADTVWTWVNNDNPEERITVPWAAVGQQSDASQSFGSGLTYSSRYFLLKYFNISTSDDDPDKFRSEQKKAAEAANKEILGGIIDNLDVNVRSFLAKCPDRAEEVKTFLSKYVKGGDYFQIKEPMIAAKVLEDFDAHFSSSNSNSKGE